MRQHSPTARLRWLHLLLAACGTVLLFTAQQLYYDTEDARQDASGEAASILAFMDVVNGPTVRHRLQPSAASLLAQAIGRFNHIDAASLCVKTGCISTDPVWRPESCTRWSLSTVCATARSLTDATSVTVRHGLADAHGQTLRDIAFLSVILSVVAAIGSTASTRMERRVALAERERIFASSHDGLTGLPNRAAFETQAQVLQASISGAPSPVLLYIDLTGFKAVNDNFGHHVGDRILQLAAERIQCGLGARDLLARLGSDEFGVVLHRPDIDAVSVYVARLISAFRAPAAVLGHSITVGVDIGAVDLDAEGQGFRETLRRADVALYEAKRQGPGGVIHFSQDMDIEARARYRLQSELKEAIADDQLYLEYQPQVDRDGQLKGVEALVRWRHPSRGLVRPDEFIAAAEQSGLIGALGLLVVRMACRDLVAARRQGMHLPYISVNVSPKQLADGSFVDALVDELRPWSLGSRDLELEVTESSLVQSKGGEEVAIRRLAGLGFRIAVDDFGTGYSSLSRLHSMPVDKLKIDRSFVTPLPGSRHDRAIPESILSLSQKLGLKTVAEGVETAEQAEWLRAAGCDLMQGYYFARPMPLQTLVDWMQQSLIAPPCNGEGIWAETNSAAEA